jgi:hypothetical protein
MRKTMMVAAAATGFALAAYSTMSDCAVAAQSFDGTWTAVVACSQFGDVKGYRWRFRTRVQGGALSGQITNPDNSSGDLSGAIGDDGNAQLTMIGRAGNSDFNYDHAAAGSAIRYTVTAHFHARSGSGKRNEQRPCSFTFTKN